jgi:hypothetical protein
MTGRRTYVIDEKSQLEQVARRLIEEFGPQVPADEIRRTIWEVASSWADAPIRNYIAILTERAAREKVEQQQRSQGRHK